MNALVYARKRSLAMYKVNVVTKTVSDWNNWDVEDYDFTTCYYCSQSPLVKKVYNIRTQTVC